MTQDLGRLSREKQTLEEQIADLFAFLSKQKEKEGLGIEVSVKIKLSDSKKFTRSKILDRRQSQPLRERAHNAAPNDRGQSQRRPLPNTLNPWNQ